MKYVVVYESADDVLTKAREHFAAHQARWAKYVTDGVFLMIGTFSNSTSERGVHEAAK